MSADNGIYILATPKCDQGHFTGENEFRVTECSAIDNIEKTNHTFLASDGKEYHVYHLYIALLFGNSEVYSSKKEAMGRASEIEDGLTEQGFYTEYGIRTLYANETFPEITYNDARKFLDEYYTSLSANKR